MDFTDFLDLDLRVRGRLVGAGLAIDAVELLPPAGPLEERLAQCLDIPRLLRQGQRLLTPLSNHSMRHVQGEDCNGNPAAAAISLNDLAEKLGALLFPPVILARICQAQGQALAQGLGLRLRLLFDPDQKADAQLAALPWELARLRHLSHGPLGLDRGLVVTRNLSGKLPIPGPMELPHPLRVTLLISQATGPGTEDLVELEREAHTIETSLRQNANVVVKQRRATFPNLAAALLEDRCHVLHFLGHGDFEQAGSGYLLFESSARRVAPATAEMLSHHLRRRSQLRLVVLNACRSGQIRVQQGLPPFTAVAPLLLRSGVPAVVAMALPILDAHARAFSTRLYQRLAAGDRVETAVTEGRLALNDPDLVRQRDGAAWAIPVLYCHRIAGRLFLPPPQDAPAEARRTCDQGATAFLEGDISRARALFAKALQQADGRYSLAEVRLCLATLAERPPALLKPRTADELNLRLGRLKAEKDSDVARLATWALLILRNDYHRSKNLKARGASMRELLRAAEKEPLQSVDRSWLRRIRSSAIPKL